MHLNDPFAVLGIEPTSDEEAVRRAYHACAKKYHPDQFQDEAQREAATQRMIVMNEAYEAALKLAASRANAPFREMMPCEEAVKLAFRMLERGSPESALRQLLRAMTRSADWYYAQGTILMEMEQFASAEQSFREAVRMDPNKVEYRRGALDALVAQRKSRTLIGRMKHALGIRQNQKE